jgi:hypothetical protein
MSCFKYTIFILTAAIFCSCRGIPEGKPPEGPIIKDPEISVPRIPDEKIAVNYMITSISTRCPAVGSAGKKIPRIANEFNLSSGNINYMPLDVWNSLINMNLIVPVLPGDKDIEYKLLSEFKSLPEENMYSWDMRLIYPVAEEIIWSDSINFKAASRNSGTAPSP